MLVLFPHALGIDDLVQQVLSPTPIHEPVEGVKAVGAVPPQVGGASSNDLVRADAVAVPVTVEAGIDGELALLHQASILVQRRQLGQALPQDQHVGQILFDPLLDFEAAQCAPLQLLRDADGNLDGPAPAFGLLVEALADGAHELGQVLPVLTLGAPLEVEGVPQPVQLDAVEIPAIEKLLGHLELQGPHSGMGEVQRRPPVEIVHQPVGIDSFEGGKFRVGQGAPGVLTVVDVVHPEGDERIQAALAAFLHDHLGRIVAGVRQALGVEVLVLGVDLYPAVPGLALRELEPVGLARPLQHVALVFGHVAAAEAEHEGVHAGIFNRIEYQ